MKMFPHTLRLWFARSDYWRYHTGRLTAWSAIWSGACFTHHRQDQRNSYYSLFHSRDVVRHQLVQKNVEALRDGMQEQHRLTAEARAERKARQEALVAEKMMPLLMLSIQLKSAAFESARRCLSLRNLF